MSYTREEVVQDLNLYFERLSIPMTAEHGTDENMIVIKRPSRTTAVQDHQVGKAIDQCVIPEGFAVEWGND